MSILRIALKNIKGNVVKSLTIFLCVLGISAFFVATTLVVQGAQNSLERGLERLGADLLVVPAGAENKIESALLMGTPIKLWMPEEYLGKIAQVEGVAAVSPQIYLQSLFGAHCCAVSEMFMVAFDPETDFSVTPWLQKNLGRGLAKGEVIGGSHVFLPEGEQYIMLYGYNLDLKGTLEPTGIGIDATLFMTKETAEELAKWSTKTAVEPLEVPPDSMSSVMVKVKPGVNPHAVAVQISRDIEGVVPIESPNLFGRFRQQMLGLLWVFIVMLGLAYLVSALLIGLVFSMAAHERRREMAVLRATGGSPLFIFRTLWTEAALLAAAGGAAGIVISSLTVYMFRDLLDSSLGMPFLFPSFGSWLGLFALALLLSLITVSIAVVVPVYRISRQEPALAMKE
jgi:putative ABC transport system permease protein